MKEDDVLSSSADEDSPMSQDHDMEMDEVKTPEEALTPDEDHELINDSSHLSSKLKEVLD